MAEHVSVPVRTVGTSRWGHLSALAETHQICGEAVRLKDQNFSFAGGHRVRLYTFKKNVHWMIPEGTPLDISGVTPGIAPRRAQR
jgi:hypothetical protein